MSSEGPARPRVLAVPGPVPLLPAGARVRAEPGPEDLGWADVLILGPGLAEPWEQLRRWRLAGHRFGAVILGELAEAVERAPLEPLLVLASAPPAGWEEALQGLRGGGAGPSELQLGPTTVDLRRRELRRATGVEALSARECELLAYLAARPQRDVGRDELQVQVWRHRKPTLSRAVDMAVARLRKKIELDPSTPRWLLSSRGDGYRLVLEPPPAPAAPPAPTTARWSGPPAPSGRLYGRDALQAELRTLLERGERLLTLVGPPGTGKTALAAALARDPALGPACWVELAAARDAEGARLALAAALGLETSQMRTGADLDLRLAGATADGALSLLVLDNAEHLIDAAAAMVSALRRADSPCRVLVTSQLRLGLRGERVIDVPPLRAEDATALFLDRAAAAGAPPETAADAASLAGIVACLDGLPLSVELAAARTRLLTPAELLARLSDRLRTLHSGPRDAPDRHASLRAALGWSWELLSPQEQDALAQISVFEGPFDLAKADEVLALEGWPAGSTALDAVDALLERSLVRRAAAQDPSEARYELLGSVRAFAREQRPPERYAGLRERHRAACVRRASRLTESAEREELPLLARRMWEEAADWTAAMEGAEDGDRSTLALALDTLHQLRGTLEQRLAALDRALALTGRPLERGLLLMARGRARLLASPDEAAAQDLREAAHLLEQSGRPDQQALALSVLGDLISRRGDIRGALEAATLATEIARACQAENTYVHTANRAYFWLILHGGAEGSAERVAELWEALGEAIRRRQLRRAYRHGIQLGAVLEDLGDAEGASRARRETLACAERLQAPTMLGGARFHAAIDALTARDYPRARRLLDDALNTTLQAGDRSRLPYVRFYRCLVDLHAGEPCRARLEELHGEFSGGAERRVEAHLLNARAQEALLREAPAEALALAEQSLAQARALSLRPLERSVQLTAALARWMLGSPAQGRELSLDPSTGAEERALAASLWWASARVDGEDTAPALDALRAAVGTGSWADRAAYGALLPVLEAAPASGTPLDLEAARRALDSQPTSVTVRLLAMLLARVRTVTARNGA